MPWKKVLALFRMMREGVCGVNMMTTKADEQVRQQHDALGGAARSPSASQADLVRASYLGTAREGFDILFARRQVRSEKHLDLAEAALEALAEEGA